MTQKLWEIASRKDIITDAVNQIGDIMNLWTVEKIQRAVINPDGSVESWDFFDKVHSQHTSQSWAIRAYIMRRVGAKPILILYSQESILWNLSELYDIYHLSDIVAKYPEVKSIIGAIRDEEVKNRQASWVVTVDADKQIHKILSGEFTS